MSGWMDVVKLRYSYSLSPKFSRNLAQIGCANIQKSDGTDFRNFDLKIFGKFLKVYIWT